MSTKTKLLLLGGVWLGGVLVLIAIYGFKGTRNEAYLPQNEFKLDTWVNLGRLLDQQGRPLPVPRRHSHHRHDDLHRAAHAAAPEQGAGRDRGALHADAQQHHRQRDGREDGGEVVPVHRHAVPVHPLLEPDRLHAAAHQHRARDHRLRPHDPLVLALRRDRQPLDPARAGAGRVRLLHVRRDPGQGPDRLHQRPRPRRRDGRHGGLHLLPRGALQPDAAPLADDPSVRQHPRRPPDHPVHGGRRSPCCSARPGWAG